MAGRTRASLRSWLPRAVLEAMFPPDPGMLRLRAAFAATLAAVLTFFLVVLLGEVVAVPIADRILGFAIGLFIAANLRDPTLRQRLGTIALTWGAGGVATALASVLLPFPLAAAAIVPPLMFVVIAGAARGPRYALIGIVSLIAYFIGLVTRQPPDTLPLRLLVLLLAAGDAALVRLVLLPDRPLAELARLRRAIHGGVVRVLGDIAAAVAAGQWTASTRAALRVDLDRFAEVVMLAQARVAALATQLPGRGGLWLHLLQVELATERAARVALEDLGAAADRPALGAMLAALQRDDALPPAAPAAPLATALTLLDQVIGAARAASTGAAPDAAAAPPPPAPVPALRPALQTAIATAAAIVGGELVSPNRWYWAAFAAFIMFQGTRSRTESIAKGAQFMAGTLAGVLAGMLLATALSGQQIATMTAIVVAVFLAFQANLAAYGTMVFWITVILGLVFGMLGYFTPDLLLLRLKETAVGALCGALVAGLVLVRREHDATARATAAFLGALAALVAGAGQALLGAPPAGDLAACILAAEQRFRELNAIARAEQLSLAGSRNEPLRRQMLLLEGCEQWARELGQFALRGVRIDDPAPSRAVRAAMGRIAATVPELVARRADPSAAAAVGSEPVGAWTQALEGSAADRAVRLLLRIDAALVNLASR
jgi:Fusaric acid resistance protein-like